MQSTIHHKVMIAGVPISSLTMEELIAAFNEAIEQQHKIRVCVTPVNCLTAAHQDPSLRNIYATANFTLCDGVPMLWAARFLGTPVKQRITGLDLLPLYINECARRGYSMYFLGAKEGVAEALVQQTLARYPEAKIAGYYSPPFADQFSDEENATMIAHINAVKTDILWVSFTAPKQDFWIHTHFDQLNVSVAIGVGGAFEVTAGLIDRAPAFFQRNGLEWFYRFAKEPKRLFRRYFIEAPVFIPLVLKQKMGTSKQEPTNQDPTISASSKIDSRS